MGVDYVLFERLVELSTHFQPKGRTLMLGRHSFSIQPRFEKRYNDVLNRHDKEGIIDDYLQEDGYCETLMKKLGFGDMEAMDFSDFEGAKILHDLNKPVVKTLEGKFDFIYDAGTIEHIFNVPVALETVFKMLKPGGRFISANGFNGWPGHGIYQFSPELVWTFWGRTANCVVHDCRGIKKLPRPREYHLNFPDPAITGKRLRLKGKVPVGRMYLYYDVERPKGAKLGNDMLQSDYETKWQNYENAGKTRFDA